MEDPKNSIELELILKDIYNFEELSFTMGKIKTTMLEEDRYALELPIPDSIIIEPDTKYVF